MDWRDFFSLAYSLDSMNFLLSDRGTRLATTAVLWEAKFALIFVRLARRFIEVYIRLHKSLKRRAHIIIRARSQLSDQFSSHLLGLSLNRGYLLMPLT